ncbi:heavy-metal-associated domain-containing protein [Stieleria sp. ICT_E10.1]|uniref:heavy-metal-associated domain-containing protein n=1 Tax=Stieleria sedimenti TaxID=2976331 RepID=UPI00217F2AA3|nr:heavy metal-associated domain-containing protein [Stieleria sedimenti]MCS7470781.1 heavy-metal-associated domain-containing protein [Stieleria sedimenti]
MRSLAYGAAILAAAGIMYMISTQPTEPAAEAVPSSATPDAVSIAPDVEVKTASLTMTVPEMHCPFACYPSVKKNLEKRADVVAVELAPQKEEGIIDNPQVIVTYKDGFDAEQAIAQLEAAGFAGSTVAQN